jgi:hypothetical protein
MTKRILLLMVITVTALSAIQAQKIAVTKGQKLESTLTTAITMDVMGQNIETSTTLVSLVEVKEVNAKGSTMANTITRMLIKSNAMGQDINFDSDKKEDLDGQMGQAVKGKIGASQEVVVDQNGKVVELKDTTKKAAGGMGDMMNMSGELAKGQAYPMLLQLPGRPVKAGDNWTDSAGTAATMKTVTNYSIKSITAEGVMVSYTGTFIKNGTVEQNGMEMQLDMSGKIKGDASYETGTGLLKKNDAVMDVSGSINVMGQNAPIAMKATITSLSKKL